jgi:hypothetical protein
MMYVSLSRPFFHSKFVLLVAPAAELLLGAAAVAVGVSAFLVALYELRGTPTGLPLGGGPLFALAAALLVFFVWWERRTPEPLLPLELFGRRAISVSALNRLLVGVVLFGQPAFVPPFLQGAMGVPPTLAGFVLSGTAIGWAIAANASGRTILRWGYLPTGLLGAALLFLGFGLLRVLDPSASLAWATTVQLVIGLGFGAATAVSFLAMQNAVGWDQRGVVTSVGQLALNVGGTVGVTLAGALFAVSLNATAGADLISNLLSPDRGAALDLAQRTAGRTLLAEALSPVYSLFVGVTLAGLGVMALLPRGRPE